MLLKHDKKLAKLLELNDDFSITIFLHDPHGLEQWLIKAKEFNIEKLNSMIETIEKDIDATKNAITYLDISNGVVEGKNCKMKMLKRIMYGRCSSKLLRAKLL